MNLLIKPAIGIALLLLISISTFGQQWNGPSNDELYTNYDVRVMGQLQTKNGSDWIKVRTFNDSHLSELQWGDDVDDRFRIYFHDNTGVASKEVMSFLSNGRIGIGTSSPTGKLHIKHTGTMGGKINAAQSYLTISDGTNQMLFDPNEITGTNDMLIGAPGNIRFKNVSTTSGNDLMIIMPNGNVGIGISDPVEKFHVQRDAVVGAHYLERASVFESGEARLQLLASEADHAAAMIHLTTVPVGGGANTHWGIHHTGAARNGRLEIGYGVTTVSSNPNAWDLPTKMVIETSGHIGIGTSNPERGLLHIYRDMTTGGIGSVETGNAGLRIQDNGANLYVDGNTLYTDGQMILGTLTGRNFLIGTNNEERLRIDPNGAVGIGTTNTSDAFLTVNGDILSTEVRVESIAGGPDYVFEEGYDLSTLEEVEAYIKDNKHLPEVPSAKEMEENGIELAQMNMLLLKKIEELTLHLIEQNKLIHEQNRRIESLEMNK